MNFALEKRSAETGFLGMDADLGIGSKSFGADSGGTVIGTVKERFGIGSEGSD
jgi:hypothetical protein